MCFSLQFVKDMLIWVVIIVALLALLQLIVNTLMPKLGPPAVEIASFIVAALKIVLWAIVAIAAIGFVIDLAACLVAGVPRLR